MYRQELYHYGVKGMKWGVRKSKKNSEKRSHNKTLTKKEKLAKAQKYGAKAMITYQKLADEYDKKIATADNNGDFETAEKLESEYIKRYVNEVQKPMIKAGYDYIHRSGGSYGINLQFGKYLSEVEYDSYGNEMYVEEYMINNGDMKAYRLEDDW